ncbi:MAG: hypothetical protein NC408_06875 [Candidatus Gastranaerophilales bacterium]|nr:hypothetical protein [Candidatus Gastranaerophilales bacterium]MCM1072477.1 hypothetical protein [Bacteroides sp.]
MKKFIFTLSALMIFTLSANAYNYNSAGPSNNFGGNVNLFPTSATLNGSSQAYQDALNASYNNSNKVYIYDRKDKAPRKPRKHGSAANKKN